MDDRTTVPKLRPTRVSELRPERAEFRSTDETTAPSKLNELGLVPATDCTVTIAKMPSVLAREALHTRDEADNHDEVVQWTAAIRVDTVKSRLPKLSPETVRYVLPH